MDLRTGEMKPHNPEDFCTKITSVAPDTKNTELFAAFMDRVTISDKALERYLQEIAGMCAVGHVLRENLIIAYGEGGNGKSTLFNLLAHVLGDYAGALSAETLTANCRKNKSPEFAELRGKRLVIAAELEEGMRLDTSIDCQKPVQYRSHFGGEEIQGSSPVCSFAYGDPVYKSPSEDRYD